MLFKLPTGNTTWKAVILIPFFTKAFITTMGKKKSNISNFNLTCPYHYGVLMNR